MQPDATDEPAAVDHETQPHQQDGHPLNVDAMDSLGALADELKPKPLVPLAVVAIEHAVAELAGGDTETYYQEPRGVNPHGIERVAVLTDDFTVRILALTTRWKWLGPYTPDDPEAYLEGRGYVPAPEPPETQEHDDPEDVDADQEAEPDGE